jgi:predicted nucleic acid-binding protein
VKFWDTSALVPLVIDEPVTPQMRALLRRDRDVIVWMLTSVELLSTLGRLGRLSTGLADLLPGVRLSAMDLFQRWASVTHVEGVRRRAERLVGVHPLSAADAMQLGAALMAAGDRPETLDIVTLDRNLARAAQLEGFRVLPG